MFQTGQTLTLNFNEEGDDTTEQEVVTLEDYSQELTQTERGYGRQWVWTVVYHSDGMVALHTSDDLKRLTEAPTLGTVHAY